jgi:beta-phosphoglucomutase-like phosphatase (HAD superfamily)
MLELDGVLGDTRPLWDDWLSESSRLLGVDPAALPRDRAVYLRPDAAVSAALRGLAASGARVGVFTDAPDELARIAVAQLGATRRVEAVEAGPGARERLQERLGAEAELVTTRAGLLERPL